MIDVMICLGFFLAGLVVGCVLTFALEHGKDTIIAHYSKRSENKEHRGGQIR